MGGFRIHQDNYADFTIVSNHFIDEYMEDANDAQLKIYLYLIRMLNADLPTGINDIADKFNYTEKDVLRALKYWEKKHVIGLEYDSAKNLVGICMLPIGSRTVSTATVVPHPTLKALESPAAVSENTSTASADKPAEDKNFEKPVYNRNDLKAFKDSDSSAQLVFVAEQYLKKTLTATEIGTLLYLSDTLKFSDDLIDYLLQYCVGRDKTDHRYIEKVALDWAESGITTPKQAAEHARRYDKIVYDVMRALGKQTNPTNVEINLINKWTRDFAYDMSVINVACERTVLNTDKGRFNYADSILTRWNALGIRNKNDIEVLDPLKKKKTDGGNGSSGSSSGYSHSNKFNHFPQNEYNFDTLEEELISN